MASEQSADPGGTAFIRILSGGKPGYTYHYAWEEPFYAGSDYTDRRTVYPCITAGCPL